MVNTRSKTELPPNLDEFKTSVTQPVGFRTANQVAAKEM